jgi:hypothetical protein
MALRQHYSFYYIIDRLLEIIDDGGSQDHHQGELETLHYWFHVERFDRKEANRRLYDYARSENVFAWV